MGLCLLLPLPSNPVLSFSVSTSRGLLDTVSLQRCSKWEMRRRLEQGKSSETFSLSFLSLNKVLSTFNLLLKRCSAGITQVVLIDSYRM